MCCEIANIIGNQMPIHAALTTTPTTIQRITDKGVERLERIKIALQTAPIIQNKALSPPPIEPPKPTPKTTPTNGKKINIHSYQRFLQRTISSASAMTVTPEIKFPLIQ